jgi:ligand-binding sensor domain-containing protein
MRLNYKIFLIFNLIFLCKVNTYCQITGLQFETYTSKNNWPQNLIEAPLQDKYGYLWIATENGLYRYDGYSFKWYYHTRKDSNSLSSNLIRTIFADNDGTIWVGTFTEGLNHLDPVTGKCKRFKFNKNDSNSISSNEIFRIFRDSKNTLWIATVSDSNGISIYNDKTGKFSRINYCKEYKPGDGLSKNNNTVNCIIETHDHKILLGSWDGIWAYDYAEKTFKVYRNLQTSNRLFTNLIVCMREDSNGAIWIGTWGGGLQKLDLKTAKYETFYWYKKEIKGTRNICRQVIVRNDSELWVCGLDTTFGIFNTKEKQFYFLKNSCSSPWDMRADNTGNLWIYFRSDTCRKLDIKRQPFSNYSLHAKKLADPNPIVSAIFTRHDSIFAGTDWSEGIYVLKNKQSNAQLINNISTYSFVSDIKADRSQNTFAIISGKNINGLYRLNNQKFKKIKFDDPSMNDVQLACMSFDHSNNIWLASYKGIFFYDVSINTVVKLPLKIPATKSFFPDITAIYADDSGKVWIAYNDRAGFSIYKPHEKKITYYEIEHDNLTVSTVLDMLQDAKGNIWQAGIGGISVWKYVNGQPVIMKNIGAEDGLQTDRIDKMATDTSGNIWCISAYGLNKINPVNFQVTHYASSLSFFPFSNFNSLFISSSDEIFVGSGAKDELFSFYPQDLKYDFSNTIIAINSFKIFNEEQPVNFNKGNQQVHLKYFQNFFSFDFVALNFSQNETITYAYKLEGFDKEWNYSNTPHYASYTNVPGGDYTFRIKAKTGDSNWQERQFKVFLYITTAWYKQWWFYLVVSFIILGLFYAIYKYRINQLVKMQLMRTRIAGELHDEVGSVLTSIAYYSELAKMEPGNNNSRVKILLDKIGGSSRKTVNSMNEIVWFINPKNDSSEQLLRRMKIVAVELIEERNISYDINFDESLNQAKLTMEQRRNIYLIFKEAINNAVKYAYCSHIKLILTLQNNILVMKIDDNGKGFNETTVNYGNGIYNMQDRAKKMNASININSKENQGTNICLELPLT